MFDSTKIDQSNTEAAVVAELAVASVEPHKLNEYEIHSVVVPDGGKIEIIDLEDKTVSPRRKKGEVTFWDGDSLATYVNRHKSDSAQLYFTDDKGYSVQAVLNDHDTDEPGWKDHLATLKMRKTAEWQQWVDHSGSQFTQEQFAEFVEENILDIQLPLGSDMLELAQSIQAKTKAEFSSSKRLDNGQQQVSYTETINASAGEKGHLVIPKEIKLGIRPFEGSDPYAVTARLRIRLRNGGLSLSYLLNRPVDIERAAFKDVVTKVAEATGITALYGMAR